MFICIYLIKIVITSSDSQQAAVVLTRQNCGFLYLDSDMPFSFLLLYSRLNMIGCCIMFFCSAVCLMVDLGIPVFFFLNLHNLCFKSKSCV